MKTFDSTLAFYVNQLDNMDVRLHEPLSSVSWGRDIMLRSGLTMANESTSFIRSSFGSVGSNKATGKPWISPNDTALPGISVNGERIVTPMRLLGNEISYTSVELERSQLLGQSIDTQKFVAMNTMYQMHTDEMVYIGDTEVGAKGLCNSTLITAAAVANGASASPLWSTKTDDEILTDINEIQNSAWAASGYAVCPDKLLIAPAKYAYLQSRKAGTAGQKSLLSYLIDESLSMRINGRALDIQPVKHLTAAGAGGTDRMVAYTNREEFVRFPMVPIRRETPYYLGIKFNAPYIWAFGEVEFVQVESLLYRDGF